MMNDIRNKKTAEGSEIEIEGDIIICFKCNDDGSCEGDGVLVLGEKFDDEDEDEDAEEEDSYKCEDDDDIDSEHDFDDDDVEQFVARATYFQKGEPIFHCLTEAEMNLKKEQIEKHTFGHYRSMSDHEELFHQMMTSLLEFISRQQLKML